MEKRILYNKDYFESDAHTSSNIERASLYFEPMIHSLNSYLKPLRVLDIGCAKGFLVFLFHTLGTEAYGVDISSYAVTHSPEDIRKNLFVSDVEQDELPFPDNHFELLTMIDVLEHLHVSSINHLLKEIKRVLRPNGYVCLTLPTKAEEKKDVAHINLQPKSFWIDLFKKYSFLSVDKEKRLLKKKSQKYLWDNKLYFIQLYKKLLKNTPPSTQLGKLLLRAGKIGIILREAFWFCNYFFCYNRKYFNEKMILFRKL